VAPSNAGRSSKFGRNRGQCEPAVPSVRLVSFDQFMPGHELLLHAGRSFPIAQHESVAAPNSVDKVARDLQ
jgi:hypothetical protein